MIDFQPIRISDKEAYMQKLLACGERGCEFSFVNLYLWGRQKLAFVHDHGLLFSQFNRRSVYLFPVCHENFRQTLDAIIADAAERGIPCRLTSLNSHDCALLQAHYPDKFRILRAFRGDGNVVW